MKSEVRIKDVLSDEGKTPTHIGGQAVMEGVMMRGKRMYAMAIRKPDQEIELITKDLVPFKEKYPLFGLPIFRGMVAFVESLVVGMKIMTISAEIASTDESYTPTSKFEIFLENKLGDKLNDVLLFISIVFALLMSVGLFMFLPIWITQFTNRFIGDQTWILGIIEGIVKIAIFVFYIVIISRQKEVRRVFAYHGAEHKTINCLESGDPLTIANVKKHSRLHKRCGTSFLLIVMLITICVFIFVRTDVVWLRFGVKLLSIPFIAGLSYEIIKWAGRSDSQLVHWISYPGLAMQKLTTVEPEDDQIEIAIAAVSEVLRHEE